ncbi:Polyadenylate-binding protein [Heracleum sosnowskyi]|uniref:Polyadenylate-binding protein n=1 Tax=Heracleum sosnowskyi TaxID=360622 RepID=A0AAD8H1X1_9APIA|nr:Polyadenylate-binding protein [Heracleum sosnowskyi]
MAEMQGGVEVDGGAQVGLVSLYVADLDYNVGDSELYEVFNRIGQVNSVRVCRDVNTRRSLGYGYVNYCDAEDAARAKEMLNYTAINGKTIRVMFSNRDPSTRASSGNIFVKNLDKSVDHKGLHDTFSTYGNILSCKIATDSSGQSKGYGFVQYDSEEGAQKAIEQLSGVLINDKQVFVGPFLSKQERELAADRLKFTNVYVKNLSEVTTEEDLYNRFGEFGKITSVVVMREEALNGKIIDQKEWYVGKAQKKSEREHELKVRYEQSVSASTDKTHGLNLYVKNLDDSFDDNKLKDVFSPYGTVTSCKVMHDSSGVSKGSGFVSFLAAEEASRVISEMNGKMVGNKPLHIEFAHRKEDRRAGHQEQYSNMHPVGMTSVGPSMPMYPPVGPGPQQIFYAQPHPAFIPPQPGFGYPPQLVPVPGMRPSGAPIHNFFVPIAQQGQQGLHPAGIIAGLHAQQGVPLMQMQLQPQAQAFPRRRAYRPPRGRGRGMPVPVRGMVPAPYNVGAMQIGDATGSLPISIEALASLLRNSSPADQRMLLGENLYPLVEMLEPQLAAKVTGMLLEMDQTEVLHLLESPRALQAKVAEALEVLRTVTQQTGTPVHQLSALSLRDGIVS